MERHHLSLSCLKKPGSRMTNRPSLPRIEGFLEYESFSAKTRTVSSKSGKSVTAPGKTRGWLATLERFQCISKH